MNASEHLAHSALEGEQPSAKPLAGGVSRSARAPLVEVGQRSGGTPRPEGESSGPTPVLRRNAPPRASLVREQRPKHQPPAPAARLRSVEVSSAVTSFLGRM